MVCLALNATASSLFLGCSSQNPDGDQPDNFRFSVDLLQLHLELAPGGSAPRARDRPEELAQLNSGPLAEPLFAIDNLKPETSYLLNIFQVDAFTQGRLMPPATLRLRTVAAGERPQADQANQGSDEWRPNQLSEPPSIRPLVGEPLRAELVALLSAAVTTTKSIEAGRLRQQPQASGRLNQPQQATDQSHHWLPTWARRLFALGQSPASAQSRPAGRAKAARAPEQTPARLMDLSPSGPLAVAVCLCLLLLIVALGLLLVRQLLATSRTRRAQGSADKLSAKTVTTRTGSSTGSGSSSSSANGDHYSAPNAPDSACSSPGPSLVGPVIRRLERDGHQNQEAAGESRPQASSALATTSSSGDYYAESATCFSQAYASLEPASERPPPGRLQSAASLQRRPRSKMAISPLVPSAVSRSRSSLCFEPLLIAAPGEPSGGQRQQIADVESRGPRLIQLSDATVDQRLISDANFLHLAACRASPGAVQGPQQAWPYMEPMMMNSTTGSGLSDDTSVAATAASNQLSSLARQRPDRDQQQRQRLISSPSGSDGCHCEGRLTGTARPMVVPIEGHRTKVLSGGGGSGSKCSSSMMSDESSDSNWQQQQRHFLNCPMMTNEPANHHYHHQELDIAQFVGQQQQQLDFIQLLPATGPADCFNIIAKVLDEGSSGGRQPLVYNYNQNDLSSSLALGGGGGGGLALLNRQQQQLHQSLTSSSPGSPSTREQMASSSPPSFATNNTPSNADSFQANNPQIALTLELGEPKPEAEVGHGNALKRATGQRIAPSLSNGQLTSILKNSNGSSQNQPAQSQNRNSQVCQCNGQDPLD